MKRPSGTILAVIATLCIAASPADATSRAVVSASAPADEYFGPFKYSAVSVRTKINALGRAYRERWSDDASIVHDAGLIESSYRAWAQKYPKDPWLAPTAFHLAQLYLEIQTPEARAKAKQMFTYVASTFAATKEGRLARLRIRQGYPALHAEASVAPTPSPYGSRAPAGPSPSGSAVPAGTAAPGASAVPVASPAAAAASAAPAASASPKPRP